MATEKLKKTYISFLVKSLIQDVDKWYHHREDNSSWTTNHYIAEYPDVTLTIDAKSVRDKLIIYNKVTKTKIYMLNSFDFMFNKNLKHSYKRMKQYIKHSNEILLEQQFMDVIPLSEMRKQKLQELLDL